MLLQRLAEYEQRIEAGSGADALPPMYQRLPVRYIIHLTREGRLPGVPHVPTDTADAAVREQKRGASRLVPDVKRTVAIRPKLLADNAEYSLGVARQDGDREAKPERVRQAHAAYVGLVARCAEATGEPAVEAVRRFLASLDLAQLDLRDFDPAAVITFAVEGLNADGSPCYPIDLPSVRAFWAREASAVNEEAIPMQCLVCGQMLPAAERLAVPIKGIPGGQQTGMALISANAKAFESYGLEASLIAPTCEQCGLRFGNALNRLLHDDATHLNVGGLAYVFWTRDTTSVPFLQFLAQPDSAQVRQFLGAPWRGAAYGVEDLNTTPFYATTLSASVTRVVVRDWIETTLAQAQRHMRRYFRLQRLLDSAGQEQFLPLWRLLRATVNAKSKREEPAPQVGQALMHVALHGGRLPDWLLYQAVRRTRAEQTVSPAHAALIKMVLLSARFEEDDDMTDDNDLAGLVHDHPEPAYHCGRLLAELESIQRHALGKAINTTILDRFYGTASTAPALVFPRLIRGAQPHLSKLRRMGHGAIAHERRLDDIIGHIARFPTTLDLKRQGLFALGYYHQRAANFRPRVGGEAAEQNETGAEE